MTPSFDSAQARPFDAASDRSRSEYELAIARPFRLDLTATVLRRLETNVVDVLTADGRYHRMIDGAHGPVILNVAQASPQTLTIAIEGHRDDHAGTLTSVRRMLGIDQDVTPFDQAAAGVSWLRPLAARMRGVRPPRYASLWEAFVNVVVFQQLSLQSASAIVGRIIASSGPAIDTDGVRLRAFPSASRFLAMDEVALRGSGLSGSKIATLRRAAKALVTGGLDPAMLEGMPSPDAASLLQETKGIGPWTATVILLRGLGRLDVFPMNDSSVTRNLAFAGAASEPDLARVIDALRPQQGMLYYHLLLARLEAAGKLGRTSSAWL